MCYALLRKCCLLILLLLCAAGAGCSQAGQEPDSSWFHSTLNTTETAPTQPTEKAFGFSELPQEARSFLFATVGAWRTELFLGEDGSFEGYFSDSNMGEIGDGYPKGTVYVCAFQGKFSTPVKQDAYTYTLALETLSQEQEAGIISYEDGFKYITADPYGLENTQQLYLFLPGKPLDMLPEQCRHFLLLDADYERIPQNRYVLYNPAEESCFSSRAATEPGAVERIVPVDDSEQLQCRTFAREGIYAGPDTRYERIATVEPGSVITVRALREKESGVWGYTDRGWLRMLCCLPEAFDSNAQIGSQIRQLSAPLTGTILSDEPLCYGPDSAYGIIETVSINTPVSLQMLLQAQDQLWGYTGNGWLNLRCLHTQMPVEDLVGIYEQALPPQKEYRALEATWVYAGPGNQFNRLQQIEANAIVPVQLILQVPQNGAWAYTGTGWLDMDVLSTQLELLAQTDNILLFLGRTLAEVVQMTGSAYENLGYFAGSELIQLEKHPEALFAMNQGSQGFVAIYIHGDNVMLHEGLHSGMNLSQLEAAVSAVSDLQKAEKSTYVDELDSLGNVVSYMILTKDYRILYRWYLDTGGDTQKKANSVTVQLAP